MSLLTYAQISYKVDGDVQGEPDDIPELYSSSPRVIVGLRAALRRQFQILHLQAG